ALFSFRSFSSQVYGQGSALDCRHHVQKLNLLQGEAEEAIGRTPRCIEVSENDSKNTAAQYEDGSVQQEGRTENSRWSKYLDKGNEDQEDEEEEAGKKEVVTERQQFCSRRRKAVEEQRKQQQSFLPSDVQEYTEENGVFQLACRAKKHKKHLAAAPNGDGGDAGDGTVPAVRESVLPEDTQISTAFTKPSKWEKFLSCSDSFSAHAAMPASSPQEGSGRLGRRGTTAADAGRAGRCSEEAGRALSPRAGLKFSKCGASTEQLASKLPGTTVPSHSRSVEEDVMFKESQSQWVRVGSGILEPAAGKCCLDSMRENPLNCDPGPKPSRVSCEHLFSTGEEFDDDL
ncbi:MRNIP protein, partial [Heliornis fulica]|nr:MRNIP protein [Heliornis fulica]